MLDDKYKERKATSLKVIKTC